MAESSFTRGKEIAETTDFTRINFSLNELSIIVKIMQEIGVVSTVEKQKTMNLHQIIANRLESIFNKSDYLNLNLKPLLDQVLNKLDMVYLIN